MNALGFENIVGTNLVAVCADRVTMITRGQFLMPKCWIEVKKAASKIDKTLEFWSEEYSVQGFPEIKEERWAARLEQTMVKPSKTVLFYFGDFLVDNVQYYTQQIAHQDYVPGINEIDTVLLASSSGDQVILGFVQFQVVSEVSLVCDKNAIALWLEDCTEISRKIVSSE